MPLVYHRELPDTTAEIGLWRITETESWFRDRLLLYPAELRQLSTIKGTQRRQEWLAARQLVHDMSKRERRGAFVKDEFGKPHLEKSLWHISISHTKGLAAAIAAPMAVGIDIQRLVPKITRLAHKFVRPEEEAVIQEESRIEHLHLYWGAKEALYKAYGRRELDFRTHIFVEPLSYPPANGQLSASIRKDHWEQKYQLYFEQWEDVMLIYALAVDLVERDTQNFHLA